MSGLNEDSTQRSSGSDIPKLRIGSRLLLDAYSQNGQLLLRAGVSIKNIKQLSRLLCSDVRFGADRTAAIPIDIDNEAVLDENCGQATAYEQFTRSVGRAVKVKNEAIQDIKSVIDRIRIDGNVDMETVQTVVADLLDNILRDKRALVSLAQLKDVDAYTFSHSVNVGILAMYVAMHSEYKDRVREIGVGALMHDIGKTRISAAILQKPAALTALEMREIKRHPGMGVEQLLRSGEKRRTVLDCVLYHHERAVGGGYPTGIKGKAIPGQAMITAIADVYDALTTTRPYRVALNPKDAMTFMTQRMAKDFDISLLQCFASVVGFYPVGSKVELSNGCVGIVLSHYATDPDRPKIMLCRDKNGKELTGDNIIDLSSRPELSIKCFKEDIPAETECREDSMESAA